MDDIKYKDRAISLVTQEFGNGTAVEVTVDGEKVLDRFDARALFTTEEEALRAGEQYGRDYIDGRPLAGKRTNADEPGKTVHSYNPGDHGTGRS
ncbi:MAG TPA: hypothetical protein VN361_03690 [Oxalicibacterium sp.]|nr:hypothetical protein [Oxalicibacterium sp.]